MRDRDAIILESLYEIISEGLKETQQKLEAMGLDEDTVKKVTDLDITKQKLDSLKLAKWITGGTELGTVLDLYKQFIKFKAKNNPKTKDINTFKTPADLSKVIGELNSAEVEKFLKDKKESERLLKFDKSPTKSEAVTLASWIKEAGGGLPVKETVDEFEKFLGYRREGIEGAANINNYPNYQEYSNFIHTEEGKEEKEEVVTGHTKTEQDAVYSDDEVAIWDIDTLGKSIRIGNELVAKTGTRVTWCIIPPLGSGRTNMYSNYRFGEGEWSFYFVWSKKREKSDPYVLTAIAKRKDGEYSFTPSPNGTISKISWDRIVKDKMPELEGKEHFFKYHPLTQEERTRIRTFERLGRSFNESDFLSLSDVDQYEYISSEMDIPVETFLKMSKERKNDYLNILARSIRRKIPAKLIRVLSPEQKDRFNETQTRAMKYFMTGVEAPLDA
jgi:hypothetical protein